MKKLLALLLLPSIAFAQPIAGNKTDIVRYGGTATTLGQKAMTASMPVVVSSDQSAIPTSQSGTWNITTLTGITNALPAGTNTIGGVILKPTTSGGLDVYTNINVNATGVNIKASAGQFYGYYCYNNNGSTTRYVRLYDSASAPTVGSTTKKTIFGIPANSAANWSSDIGIAFTSGIGIGATGAVGDADTTNPSSNDVVCTIYYK